MQRTSWYAAIYLEGGIVNDIVLCPAYKDAEQYLLERFRAELGEDVVTSKHPIEAFRQIEPLLGYKDYTIVILNMKGPYWMPKKWYSRLGG